MLLKQDPDTGWWVVAAHDDNIRLTNIHENGDCDLYCDVHNRRHPQDSGYPLNWRTDRGIMEFICPCGNGHPTYAQSEYNNKSGKSYENTHGCCMIHC